MRVQRVKLNKAVLLILVLSLLFIRMAYSADQITIKFLYHDPRGDPGYSDDCDACVFILNDYLYKNSTLANVEKDYGSQVSVSRIKSISSEGLNVTRFYNITKDNSVIIGAADGNFTTIQGYYTSGLLTMTDSKGNVTTVQESFDEAVREIIDAYIGGENPSFDISPLIALLITSYTLGFLESFSPCLIALLSFVLFYTLGKTKKFREGLLQVMTFAVGFIFAAILLGLTVQATILSVPSLYYTTLGIVVIFALLFGLDLLGFNIFTRVLKLLNIKFETKPLVAKLSKKYMFTYSGLILLGFVFYFLDPCIAPVFVPTLSVLPLENFSLAFSIFVIGVITPFFIFGILAGYISKLARSTYRHRSKIRAVSGLILIGYAIYIIIQYFIL